MYDIEIHTSKEDQYRSILKQVKSIIDGEPNTMANLSNLCSIVHFSFGHHWTGVYKIVENDLVLLTFQGPPACTRIAKGKGVCGTAWLKDEVQIVASVHEFEGHIACSSETNSEIVVPMYDKSGDIWGVFDIDSKEFDKFDLLDKSYLEELISLVIQ